MQSEQNVCEQASIIGCASIKSRQIGQRSSESTLSSSGDCQSSGTLTIGTARLDESRWEPNNEFEFGNGRHLPFDYEYNIYAL